ncbi:MAG: Ig-like domain-containing protein, partial [Paramuribaculum sp.]|nr:Ig-like domain-containing protein [Paramuribaculum sp.]
EEVAMVNANGLVTAVSQGEAIITATTANGLTASCTVTVLKRIIYAENISLNITEVELTEGESVQITATVLPDNADDKTVAWSSSDEAIATVDANGLVTAIAKGEAVITAKTTNGLTATCRLTVVEHIVIVTPVNPESISLNLTEAELIEGESVKLTATVAPDDADDRSVSWTSDNPAVATVDADGLVTAVSQGETTVTATTSNSLAASCRITVVKEFVRTNSRNTVRVENGDIVLDGEGTAEVYNLSGRHIVTSANGRITGLPHGIYFVRFASRSYKIRL